MKLSKFLAPIAIAGAFACVPMASHAELIIQITDGVHTLNIADGSNWDSIAQAGAVSYSGAFQGWMFTVGIGSSTADPLSMHLNATVMGDRTDGKIWIKFTHTGLDAALGPMTFAADAGGSSTAPGSRASWAAYVDDDDLAFGQGQTVFGANGYQSTGGAQPLTLNGTYSATLITSFDYSGLTTNYLYGSSFEGQSSLAASLNVSEPSSMALIGLGLVGMGVTRRRRA